jgi:hypothetical protein
MSTVNPGPSSQVTNNTQNAPVLLFVLRGCDLTTLGDQIFTRVFSGLTWDPYFITVNQTSGAVAGSPAGGMFTLPGKGGSAIVSTGQSYSGLSGARTHVNCTIQASTTTFTTTPFFNLTTTSTASCIADIFIYGVCYD